MDDAEVDSKGGNPDLRYDCPASCGQSRHHRALERRFDVSPRGSSRRFESAGTVFGEGEEVLEIAHSTGAATAEIHLVGPHRREDNELPPGPGDRHVEASVTALAVERTDLSGDPARGIRPCRHREQDHVALVALHGLEVLHEDRLFPDPPVEEPL